MSLVRGHQRVRRTLLIIASQLGLMMFATTSNAENEIDKFTFLRIESTHLYKAHYENTFAFFKIDQSGKTQELWREPDWIGSAEMYGLFLSENLFFAGYDYYSNDAVRLFLPIDSLEAGFRRFYSLQDSTVHWHHRFLHRTDGGAISSSDVDSVCLDSVLLPNFSSKYSEFGFRVRVMADGHVIPERGESVWSRNTAIDSSDMTESDTGLYYMKFADDNYSFFIGMLVSYLEPERRALVQDRRNVKWCWCEIPGVDTDIQVVENVAWGKVVRYKEDKSLRKIIDDSKFITTDSFFVVDLNSCEVEKLECIKGARLIYVDHVSYLTAVHDSLFIAPRRKEYSKNRSFLAKSWEFKDVTFAYKLK